MVRMFTLWKEFCHSQAKLYKHLPLDSAIQLLEINPKSVGICKIIYENNYSLQNICNNKILETPKMYF